MSTSKVKASALELRVIDLTIKMFSEPVLELDLPLLEQHLEARLEQPLSQEKVEVQEVQRQDNFLIQWVVVVVIQE
jgi:hypothetical protein